jgi:CTP synthase (UTP-ammonia lyase)
MSDAVITKENHKTKYIFVTGGVVSGLGKGITAASIGLILKTNGYKVDAIKFDPYLNVDPGTMSPFEHGEVFVLGDGTECDLDLGHYERFLDTNLTNISSVTAGKIYSNILEDERRGDYLGKNVQLIPHVTNYIKERFVRDSEHIDVRIIEIGGSAGDMEGEIFMEAIRQFRQHNRGQVLHFHLGYVPFLECSGEYKTKPFQNSLRELLRTGLQPHILVARYEKKPGHDISKEQLDKLALFGNVDSNCVIPVPDLNSIYAVPSHFYASGVMERLSEFVSDIIKISTKEIPLLRGGSEANGVFTTDSNPESNQTKYLIFDFDGVICNGLESDISATTNYYLKEGGWTSEVIRKYFFDYFEKPVHGKDHDLTQEEIDALLKRRIIYAKDRLKNNEQLFQRFVDNILSLKNTKLAIVSSSSDTIVIPNLGMYKSNFDFVYGFEDGHSKEEKIAKICKEWGVSEQSVYYFTGTKTDILELEDYLDKSNIIGCTWGYQGFDKLNELLPESQILRDFDDVLGYEFVDVQGGNVGVSVTSLSKPLPLFFQQGGKVINPTKTIKLAVVGKYGSRLGDADYSVMQSIAIAGFYANVKVEPIIIAAEDLENNVLETWESVKAADAFLVLGGFGNRGMEGKILAAKYARENKKPFLGICLGLQMAVVEFARNVCGLNAFSAEMLESETLKVNSKKLILENSRFLKRGVSEPDGVLLEYTEEEIAANSTVSDLTEKEIVIDYMKGQESIQKKGGTMRLGDYECEVVSGTLASQLFGVDKTVERHRHRLEVQTKYLDQFAAKGLSVSGKFYYTSGEGKQEYLPEIMELDQNIHPYFIGIQSHPEMLSRPTKAHPLFLGLIKACLE